MKKKSIKTEQLTSFLPYEVKETKRLKGKGDSEIIIIDDLQGG